MGARQSSRTYGDVSWFSGAPQGEPVDTMGRRRGAAPAIALAAALLREGDEHTLARASVDAVVRLGYPVEGQRVADGY